MTKLIKGMFMVGLMVIFIEIGLNGALGPVDYYSAEKNTTIIPISLIETNHAQFYNDFTDNN